MDVLIIGAGAAGLAACRELQSNRLNAAILEARSHLGGRILTHRSTPTAIELGAEFIHGKPSAIWSLVKKARLDASEKLIDLSQEQLLDRAIAALHKVFNKNATDLREQVGTNQRHDLFRRRSHRFSRCQWHRACRCRQWSFRCEAIAPNRVAGLVV